MSSIANSDVQHPKGEGFSTPITMTEVDLTIFLGAKDSLGRVGLASEDIRELIVLNHLTRCRSPDTTTALKVQLLSSTSTEKSIQAFRVH
ncbi:hypothetical protein BHE90_005721 [Fusarium euwallaceae]|uniref:Uncharacterized protein n=1 Tax=Fusarium euwallaceae TaxID=1147111 RepID=A0A430LVQ9_9HYPO|nr:hypothetical protein BHE90_005721 [Fusarium euwallaceae]